MSELGYDLKLGAYKDECTGTYWIPINWPMTAGFVPTDVMWERDDIIYRRVERKDMTVETVKQKRKSSLKGQSW